MKRQLFSASAEAEPQDCAQCGKPMLFGVIRAVVIGGEKFRVCSQKCQVEIVAKNVESKMEGETVAHNDHLKEPALVRERGVASGIHYKGVGAVMAPGYILLASDITSLRGLWGRLTDVPLNEEACYPLAVFAQKDCT